MDFLNQFKIAMQESGLTCPEFIIANGEINRFHVEGDKQGTLNGWYILFADDIPAGAYGCWRRNINQTWCATATHDLSSEQKRTINECITLSIEKRKQALKEAHQKAKQKAQQIWEKSLPASDNHQYLLKKKVKAYGVKEYKGKLVIPLFDTENTLHSLQFINIDGDKWFLTDGVVKGHYHQIGELTETLYLCEGYATGCSIYEATNYCVMVTFNAGNLLPIAQAIKQKYPNIQLIICADDDRFTDGNPGVTKAEEAAALTEAKVIIPHFKVPDDTEKLTDFNDLAVTYGLDEVKIQLTNIQGNSEKNLSLPANFTLTDKGLFYVGEDNEDKPLFISSPIVVTAYFRNQHNENYGLVLEFEDIWDRQLHTYLMPFSQLERDDKEYCAILASKGLKLSSNSRALKYLKIYLKEAKPTISARIIYKTGWHNNCFVLPNAVYGKSMERLLLEHETQANIQSTEGTLELWQKNIALLCVGNSRLVFAMSCAFATPLLHLTGDENGGFHLRGASSCGKTTALLVASSVWGNKNYLQRWRATTNGLEALAAIFNDLLLCLDEIAQVEAREAGEIAYMLANGSGKQRANKNGLARERAYWRLLFLSTGEISLAEHMQDAGKRSKAGQEIRLADIPADAGKNLGIFENLHSYDSAANLAKSLNHRVNQYYGVAGQAFLNGLTQADNLSDLSTMVEELREDFIRVCVPPQAHGQVYRVAQRFALIAAGGEIATVLNITGWQKGEAIKAAKTCFDAWLDNRDGTGNQEDKKILAQIKHFFELYGDARFANFEGALKDAYIKDRAGFKKDSEYYVLPEVFKNDLCKGLNWREVARLLVHKGWLLPDSEGKSTRIERLPMLGTVRCYRFTAKLWEAE